MHTRDTKAYSLPDRRYEDHTNQEDKSEGPFGCINARLIQ